MPRADATDDHVAGRSPVPRLTLTNVSKRYPAVQANDRVNLEVMPGEIHAVLGENGAGKSTLMKIIYGAVRPDEGRIAWDGAPVTIANPRQARADGRQPFSRSGDLSQEQQLRTRVRAQRAQAMSIFAGAASADVTGQNWRAKRWLRLQKRPMKRRPMASLSWSSPGASAPQTENLLSGGLRGSARACDPTTAPLRQLQ